jgi:hypothetical protein
VTTHLAREWLPADGKHAFAAALTGARLPAHAPPTSRLLTWAREHRLGPLLHRALATRDARPAWADALVAALADEAREAAVIDAVRTLEERRVIAALADDCERVVVLKGAALAHSVYEAPHERPRLDLDVLVPRDRVDAARAALARAGYAEWLQIPIAARDRAVAFHRTDERGVRHELDVHWFLTSSVVLRDRVDPAPLLARAVPLDALPGARALRDDDALAFACLHAFGDLPAESPPLVWLYDLHLLLARLDEAGVRAALDTATGWGARSLLLHGLREARAWLGTELPEALVDEVLSPAPEDAASFYLRTTRARHLIDEWLHLPGARAKLGLARDVLWPPDDYLWRRYATGRDVPTWPLRIHRLVTGGASALRSMLAR